MKSCVFLSPSPRIALISLVLAAFACTPMRESAKSVRVGKEIPNPSCRELSSISASSHAAYVTNETRVNTTQNKLRMKTEELGGNYVLMDTIVVGGDGVTISGRALACPESSWEPAPAPVVAPKQEDAAPAASGGESEVAAPHSEAPKSPEERLKHLDKLKSDGLISEEEYAKKRQEILNAL